MLFLAMTLNKSISLPWTLIAPMCLTGLLGEAEHLRVYSGGGNGVKQGRGHGGHKWDWRQDLCSSGSYD